MEVEVEEDRVHQATRDAILVKGHRLGFRSVKPHSASLRGNKDQREQEAGAIYYIIA